MKRPGRRNWFFAIFGIIALSLTGISFASAHTLNHHGSSTTASAERGDHHRRHNRYSIPRATPSQAPAPAPTATPTPTPTKTAPVSSGANGSSGRGGSSSSANSSALSTGVLPDASNTGVPAGVSLTNSGGLTVTKAGTVLSGLNINGSVLVRAPNVTIKNSRIYGRVDTGDQSQYPGTMIDHVEIIGPYSPSNDGGYPGVGYTDYTCNACNIHGWGKGFDLVTNVVITNSWVHDIQVFGDPANGGSHNEAILSVGGSNFTIVNNNLDSGNAPNVSASLALYSQLGSITNVLAQGNLFNGGGYCVYAGLAGTRGASNVRFLDNTFGSKYNPKCGYYGPGTAYQGGNGDVWSGNILQSSGAEVPTPAAG